jgi:hypothetical protein
LHGLLMYTRTHVMNKGVVASVYCIVELTVCVWVWVWVWVWVCVICPVHKCCDLTQRALTNQSVCACNTVHFLTVCSELFIRMNYLFFLLAVHSLFCYLCSAHAHVHTNKHVRAHTNTHTQTHLPILKRTQKVHTHTRTHTHTHAC